MTKRYASRAEATKVRIEACRCAATVLAGRPEEKVIPLVWSLTVFFESYIAHGAKRTERDFGPKEPAKLRVAE
jgi:hypothetical protein